MSNSKNVFDEFTNLYELQKTLRFELKPAGNTTNWLKKHEVFKKDEQVSKNYNEAKPYFDLLHKRFINDSLKGANLDIGLLEEYWHTYKQKQADKKVKFDKIEKKLRSNIVKEFEKAGNKWQEEYLKKGVKFSDNEDKGLKFLFGKNVLNILEKDYPDVKGIKIKTITNEKGKVVEKKEEMSLFKTFPGSTYFSNFQNSRRNFYSEKDIASGIPNRIVNENLKKFCDNKWNYEQRCNNKERIQSLLNEEEKSIFELKFFNNCFLQAGINNYNRIIAKNANSKINELRQDGVKIPFFKELFKQILEEKLKEETERDSFIKIEKNQDVFPLLRKFVTDNNRDVDSAKKIFFDLVKNIDKLSDEEMGGIFISGNSINTISSKWFKSWFVFGSFLPKQEKNKNKVKDFVSLKEIKESLNEPGVIEKKEKKFIKIEQKDLFKEEFCKKGGLVNIKKTPFVNFLEIWDSEFRKCFDEYYKALEEVEKMINEDREFNNKLGKLKNGEDGEIQKETIKDYAESALTIYQIMKYFAMEKGKKKVTDLNEDERFYNEYNKWNDQAKTWLYFNEFRNYLSKKPYGNEKIKLNFENGILIDGWNQTKEKEYCGTILFKENKYYLGIISKDKNGIFDFRVNNDDSEKVKKEKFCLLNEVQIGKENGVYKKIEYYQIADAAKDVPRLLLSAQKAKDFFQPSAEILRIYENKTFKKESKDKFNQKDLAKIIDYYKDCIKKYKNWKIFKFNFSDTAKYSSIKDFTDEVNKAGYKIDTTEIAEEYINKKINDGSLYLFEVYNKDFAKKANGSKNLHTLYWENLFSDINLADPLFKLNGQAEIFYRDQKIEKRNEIITEDNKRVINDHNHKGEKAYQKNRYTKEKIMFHCPITLNFARNGESVNIKTVKIISETNKFRVIGIDRGEKHLIYVSTLDWVRNKIENIRTKSLNVLFNGKKEYPYQEKLDKKEKERDQQRKSWQSIQGIKDMKTGYVSQAVNEISKLIFEALDQGFFPIIIFENLNIGFKRGRFKIEKQVYQNLELALAKKLNYLVRKERNNLRQALQLTPEVKTFGEIDQAKQFGTMFYIPASFTSAICPICGFRKRLYGFGFTNKEQAKKMLFEKHNFKINFEDARFIFECEASEDKEKKEKNKNELFKDVNLDNRITFYSDVNRLLTKRSGDNRKWETNPYDPTAELIELLFNKHGTDRKGDIAEQIKEKDFNADFYKDLIFAINMVLRLRNSHSQENKDFIHCPYCHFHSDKGFQGNEWNGDANGAYNIARKGILMTKKIKEFLKNYEIKGFNQFEHLKIEMREWDKFVQQK